MESSRRYKFLSGKYLAVYLIFLSIIYFFTTFHATESDQGLLSNYVSSVRYVKELKNWQFQLDTRDIGEKERWFDNENSDWARVKVPMAWDCYEDALWQYQGIGWYTTTILPSDFIQDRKVVIRFGRVMQYSKVWLNGEYIGEYIGGYLPFSFDISRYLRTDRDNQLVIRVDNRARIEWLPASEQIEWLQYGGILEPVELISKSKIYIKDLKISTVLTDDGAQVKCELDISNETEEDFDTELNIDILGITGSDSRVKKMLCKSESTTKIDFNFHVKGAALWSPDSPNLYTSRASLKSNGKVQDMIDERFGIREIEIKGTSIILNGSPMQVKGSHRYDAYDRFGPNPPEHLVRDELALMKSVGVNLLRVHYPASPDFLDLLDEYGLMMMEELPLTWWGIKWKGLQSIGGEAEQSLEIFDQAKSTLTEMIGRDKNHPCIVIWSMANECVTTNEIGITVMRELLKLAKSLDPTRLVTFAASGNPVNHFGFDEADIVCFNQYFICDHINQINSVVYETFTKELKTYRNHFPNKPIIVSEFGRQGIKGIHGDVFYSEDFQAAMIESVWKAIDENPTISGGILWTWADYFHESHFALHGGYGFYGVVKANYGSFGVVTGDRKHKKSLESLARMFNSEIP